MLRVALPVALALALSLAATARASVGVRASVEDLAEACDLVVEGDVGAGVAAAERGGAAIWTTYRVAVRRTLAGAPARDVIVRVPGGRLGDVVQETLGAPRLEEGSRVVLFLGPDAGAGREVTGLAQGLFRVRADPATGKSVCANDLAGLSLVDARGTEVASDPVEVGLDDLARRVAAARARAGERARIAAERVERRLARWRAAALRHAEAMRGRPGGAPR